MNDIKPWCIDPFIQMAHTADGFYRVCCIGEVQRELTDLNTKEITPLEYWNNDISKQIRNDMFKPIEEFSNITKYACNQCLKNNRDNANLLISKILRYVVVVSCIFLVYPSISSFA